MNWLGSIVCRIRGKHRWTRRKGEPGKRCVRCAITKSVKPRKVVAADPLRNASLTNDNQTRYEGKK